MVHHGLEETFPKIESSIEPPEASPQEPTGASASRQREQVCSPDHRVNGRRSACSGQVRRKRDARDIRSRLRSQLPKERTNRHLSTRLHRKTQACSFRRRIGHAKRARQHYPLREVLVQLKNYQLSQPGTRLPGCTKNHLKHHKKPCLE